MAETKIIETKNTVTIMFTKDGRLIFPKSDDVCSLLSYDKNKDYFKSRPEWQIYEYTQEDMYKVFLIDYIASSDKTDKENLETGRVKPNPSYIINMGELNDQIPIPVDIVNSCQGAFLFKAKDVLLSPGEITVPVNFLVVDDKVISNMVDNVMIVDFRNSDFASFYEMTKQLFNDEFSISILCDYGLINKISEFSYVLEKFHSKKY